jgi:broad specificity phosphatase PhoE
VDDPTGTGPLNGDDGTADGRVAPARVGEPSGVTIPNDLDATLVLVRHGESEAIAERRFQGQLDTPLSATGRRQAELAAQRLARPHDRPALPIPAGPPLAIVHSPLGRAAETAAAIHAAASESDGFDRPIPIRSDPGFPEIGQGSWEGRLSSEIAANDGDRLAAWRRTPTLAWAPGGERLADVRARVAPALTGLLAELAAAGTPGSITEPQMADYGDAVPEHPWTIVVGHGGAFRVTLLTLFDLPLERFWMWSLDLCGITVVELRAGRPVVRAMNLTEHLAGLLDEEAREAAEARTRTGAL